MPEWKILRQLYFLVDMWSTLLVLKIVIIRTSMHMNWHINGLGLITESGKHHWLQEGFATYYAALAEREIWR
jgi:hypothetical protein